MRSPPTETPPLRSIAVLFGRLGNVTFGGGDAITATLLRELVYRRGWLSLDRYALAQSLAKITPGTGILAFSAATAWMLRGWRGSVAAVLAIALPSGLFTVLLTWGFMALGGSPLAVAALDAILASAVGLMWAAARLLAKPQMGRTTWLRTAVMVVGAFVALARWSISPVQILAVAALVGAFWVPREPADGDEPGDRA